MKAKKKEKKAAYFVKVSSFKMNLNLGKDFFSILSIKRMWICEFLNYTDQF